MPVTPFITSWRVTGSKEVSRATVTERLRLDFQLDPSNLVVPSGLPDCSVGSEDKYDERRENQGAKVQVHALTS